MDLEDFAVNNILLPVGSLLFVLFCTTRFGWGFDNYMKEANEGKGLKIAKWMKGYMTFGLPLIILVIFVLGLISYFS
jgi:NSS family neurotransmitter:Na+ symporter